MTTNTTPPPPVTNRRLLELGVPETVLRSIRDQAQEGTHFGRNPEEGGRIEWTEAGVDLLVQHADLAGLQAVLSQALKKAAPVAPAPSLTVLVAIRRAINPVMVRCRHHGHPVGAPEVRCRVHVDVGITPGFLLRAKPVEGMADLFEIVGKPYRERV